MEKNKLLGIMIVVAIFGAIAGFFKLGGDILERGIDLAGLITGPWFVAIGLKTNKASPDKTIKIFNKTVKTGVLLIVAGIAMFIYSFIFLLIP